MNENPNNNCLAGMKCPSCGAFAPFRIMVTQSGMTLVSDDGTDDIHGAIEWDNASLCECPSCGHEGRVAQFKAAEAPVPPQSASSVQMSLDGGLTWINLPDGQVRLNYRDADEDDDTLMDLSIVASSEGLILDLVRQNDGSVCKTWAMPIESLIEVTA